MACIQSILSQSAVNKLNIDWKEQAVLRAKSYQKFHYSKEKLVGQLVDVDLFTPEEADYAIEKSSFQLERGSCERSGIFCKRWQYFERKVIRNTC